MKKITLLLIAFPMLLFSQVTFDFKTSQDALGWVKAGGASDVSIVPEGLAISWIANKAPKIRQTALNVDASVYKWIAVTLINSSTEANFMKLAHFKGNAGSGTKFIQTAITEDLGSKTYYYDLTHTEWVNYSTDDPSDFDIFFNIDGGNLQNPSTSGDIIISKIEFLELPYKSDYTFDFDGDNDGWIDYDVATTVAGGFATSVPVVGATAKIRQETFRVDAANASHVHIVYKNESQDNDQLRVAWVTDDAEPTYPGVNIPILKETTGFETVSFDITAVKGADWTAHTAKNLSVAIRDTENANKASAGNLIIDRIVFNNEANLSVGGVKSNPAVSLYPNPVNDVLNISSATAIESVTIYSITGKLVTIQTTTTSQLSTSNLASGIYIVKIAFENGTELSQKFVKQ